MKHAFRLPNFRLFLFAASVLGFLTFTGCEKSDFQDPNPEPTDLASLKKPEQTGPQKGSCFMRTDYVVVPPCDSWCDFPGFGEYNTIKLSGKAVTLYNAVTVTTTIVPTQPTVKVHAWFIDGDGPRQEVSWFYSFAWSEDCSRQYDNMPVNHGNLNDLPVGFPVKVAIEASPKNWHEVSKWDYFVWMIEYPNVDTPVVYP